jgi:undecaprenyl phosphate-alpha-L-ara4N flippase subunit ArnE
MTPLIPLSGGVVLNSLAQISLRHGTAEHARHGAGVRRLWIGLWATCFGLATLLWLIVLRQAEISYVYPLLGAGYILVTVLARILLNERISTLRWLSILVITAGVVMVGVNQ